MKRNSVVIIGAGIIGLATALRLLQQRPNLKVTVVDKESQIAGHQTGHNSGVIHTGIYYKPGSLKAQNCSQGVKDLLSFCQEHNISYELCGKLIVATHSDELPRLKELENRGKANGVDGLRMISKEMIKEIEPSVQGIQALFSPTTGIIDYMQVAETYAKMITKFGGEILLNNLVIDIRKGLVVTNKNSITADIIINCAGIHADRLGHLADKEICRKQILPFRGEYYELIKEKRGMIKGLVYPVPDPQFPFLGVHLSRTINGSIEAGPNAVLAYSREGYAKSDIKFSDCLDMLTYKGFWSMAFKYWKIGMYEFYRSYSKKAFLKSLQRLVPDLRESDIIQSGSGVRSQVVFPDGRMSDDFLIMRKPGIINVLNAPSPGATASLAIGKYIADLSLS